MKKYIVSYRGRNVEVTASSLQDAKQKAIAILRLSRRESRLMTFMLAEDLSQSIS